eukprot:7253517-Pyramimonas_sp.AAC.1
MTATCHAFFLQPPFTAVHVDSEEGSEGDSEEEENEEEKGEDEEEHEEDEESHVSSLALPMRPEHARYGAPQPNCGR